MYKMSIGKYSLFERDIARRIRLKQSNLRYYQVRSNPPKEKVDMLNREIETLIISLNGKYTPRK